MKRVYPILAAAVLGGGLFTIGGCWNQGSSTIVAPQEITPTNTESSATLAQRVQGISTHLAAYTEHAKHLPGSTDFVQRAMMETIFDDLSEILPLLQGPNPDAIFRQQLKIVQSTKQQLISLPPEQSCEAIVATGLRAVYDAFEDLSTTSFADQTQLAEPLNSLSAKLDEISMAPAGEGRPPAAAVTQMIGGIIQQMNVVLTQRLAASTQASTQSSTEPTTEPTTNPTTESSTEPASEPSPATMP